MENYPDYVHEMANALIRSGTTPEELTQQCCIGHSTAYRWLRQLRSKGEEVSFLDRSASLKDEAFARMEQGASVQALIEELAVSRATIYRWRVEYKSQDLLAGSAPPGKDEPSRSNRRKLPEPPPDVLIKQLKIALAEKTIEVDFFRGALREVEARRRQNTERGEKPSTGGSSK
jgi:transposase